MKQKFFQHKTTWILGGILLLGLIVRLINIQAEPLWGDEILSLDIYSDKFSGLSFSQMITYIREVEVHPPLYYILMRGWTALFGASNFSIRLPSLLAGLGMILLGYKFATSLLKSQRAGLISAFFIAILPIQIEFGQEARPYTLFSLLGLIAAYCLWQLRSKQKNVYLLGYVASGVAALYLHYSAFFILAGLAGWWLIDLIQSRECLKGYSTWLGAHGLILLGFFWWLPTFFYKYLIGQFLVTELPRNLQLLRTVNFFPDLFYQIIWTSKENALLHLTLALIFIAIILTIICVVIRLTSINQEESKPSGKAIGYIASLIIIPSLLFVIAPQSVNYTTIVVKHLLFITIPISLLFGFVLSGTARKIYVIGLICLSGSLIPFQTTIIANDADWDWNHRIEEAADFINQHYKPGDLVVIHSAIGRTNLTHFLNNDIPVASIMPLGYFGDDVRASRHQLGFIENEYQFRISEPDLVGSQQKLDRLTSQYAAKRVWLYDVKSDDAIVRDWFTARGWRHNIQALDPIFLLDLYVNSPPHGL